MTTTSEKILSEMERMGRMKIKDLCAQIGWQYQKFRRRIKANDFSPEDLALIATSMNTIQPYLPPTSVESLTGDPPLPDVLYVDIEAEAINATNDGEVRQFTGVPIRDGYLTTYTGTFFVSFDMGFTFLVGDWNDGGSFTF